MKNSDRIWYRRLAALIMALVMMTVIPVDTVSAASAQSDKQKVRAGDILIGLATLYGLDGTSVEMGFAYSSGCILSDAAISAINQTLSNINCGLDGARLSSDSLTKQRFFAVGIDESQKQGLISLRDQLNGIMPQNEPVSETDVTEPPVPETTAVQTSPTDAVTQPGTEPSSQVVSPSGGTPSGGSVSDSNGLIAPKPVSSSSDQQTASDPAQQAAGTTALQDNESDFNIDPQAGNSIEKVFFQGGQYNAAAALPVYGTIERSFAQAFPEFNFGSITYTTIPAILLDNPNVSASDSNMGCTVTVTPEPVAITHSVFGEEVTSIMVAPLPYEYNVKFGRIIGLMNGLTGIPTTTTTTTTTTAAETTTTTVPETTVPTISTTTETITTTTTIAVTTAPTTFSTESTTTTALTQPTGYDYNNNGVGRSGFVNTRRKRLRLRATPCIDDNIITYMPKGTHLTILNTNNPKWYYVRMDNGQEGYCWAGYVGFN